MKKLTIAAILLALPLQIFAQIFINEIDYDQPSTDTGEFIELTGTAGTYNNVTIVLMNGNGNTPYNTIDLGNITLTDETNGFGFYVIGTGTVSEADFNFSNPDNNVQNGAPDGVELQVDGTIVDAASYEGELNDSNGDPMEVATPDDSYWEGDEGKSIGRVGLDGSRWEVMDNSPGAKNNGQSLEQGLPVISNVFHSPSPPNETESVTVTADVTDADGTISSVELFVSIDGGDFSSSAMTNSSGDTYSGTIAAQSVGTEVSFYIEATDNDTKTSQSSTYEYTVISSSGYSIAEIQETSDAGTGGDCYPSPYVGQPVSFSGIVTASSEGTRFVQDARSLWSGVKVYDSDATFTVGDSVSITGSVSEYFGMTEVSDLSDYTIHTSDNSIYDPMEVSTGTLGGGCSSQGESYEGMLVVLNDVTVTGTADQYGQWFVDDGSGEAEIEDTFFPYEPTAGEQFDQIIGVVNYGYEEYEVLPRSEDDLVKNADAPTISGITSSPDFVRANNQIEIRVTIEPTVGSIDSAVILYGSGGSFPNTAALYPESGNEYVGIIPAQSGNSEFQYKIYTEDDQGNSVESPEKTIFVAAESPMEIGTLRDDISTYEGQVVTVSGIVTIGAGVLVDTRTEAYIQDASGRGVQLFHPDLMDNIARGDKVTAVGRASVFDGILEIENFRYTIESTDNTLPEAEELTIAEANNSAWEGTFIRFTGTITDKWWAGGGTNLEVADETDTTIVRIWDVTGIDTTDFAVGTQEKFRGVAGIYIDDGQTVHQLLLGYESDYGTQVSTDPEDLTQPQKFALSGAYPNPFNPATNITWHLDKAGQHELAVYNLLGQKIRVLSTGYATAGRHMTQWNAGDQPSGIYFFRLTADGRTLIKKATLLR
ncbi:MAG: T9SS type A sorting domain-containing protein [Candidatus Marinimicrobia bacterium]|nr:T9SS type A sorting domain-containing protein [Candidatus Neomarinimicrobiota bacterium]MCF7829073.1 T9SS type A sorting domain-containing protein [Candidatus Neomarinimicrobiota bacterium]MCF7881790.1 T9SS type A sorting domain-containing protein [Candidatus Neomarinimicrobiota bacterium]